MLLRNTGYFYSASLIRFFSPKNSWCLLGGREGADHPLSKHALDGLAQIYMIEIDFDAFHYFYPPKLCLCVLQ